MTPPSSPQEIAETMSQSTGEQSQALANPNPSQEQVPDSLGSLDPNSQTKPIPVPVLPRLRNTTTRFDPSTPLRQAESTVRCNITRAGGGAGGKDRAVSPELPNTFSNKVQNRKKK